VWPIRSDVGDGFAIGVKLMLVVSRAMLGMWMAVVIPKDVLPIPISRMVGISDGPSLSPLVPRSDLEVLGNINDYVFMTKDIPENLTSFRGCLDLKGMTNYKWVTFHDSQHDVQVVFQIAPVVLYAHFLA